MDPKKREQRRIEKAMRDLAASLQQVGGKTPVKVPDMDFTEAAREAQTKRYDNPGLEAEAVLSFLYRPARYILKKCKECGLPFGTNYHAVAYCEDACRAKALQSQIGIRYNPHKQAEERWGGEPPSIIPPAAMMKLLSFLQRHPDLVETAQTETQVQNYYEENGLMSKDSIPEVSPEKIESEPTPIYDEASHASASETSEPKKSEEVHEAPENVPADSPATTDSPQQPAQEPQTDNLGEDSVFDFESDLPKFQVHHG